MVIGPLSPVSVSSTPGSGPSLERAEKTGPDPELPSGDAGCDRIPSIVMAAPRPLTPEAEHLRKDQNGGYPLSFQE
jgi:hypothetical protein